MLGRPAGFGLASVVVCPDDFVQETIWPEEGVE